MSAEQQPEILEAAEKQLKVNRTEMAKLMGTPEPTYKKWRNGTRQMPAVAHRCLELVLKTGGKF